mmetsp:Transcript_2281/g.4149  ORF Transcript_2281/g.4149 Transcript_2281/m.4149 type:complete len:166 (-) Transcript_2281:55-552(-)|eukprot:CAMPEP_0197647470 /NCGR_PEP_ID=MMETSP1338-20131121/25459_1 /TAXON_ID=43686 ORGANISM="Pelagodinium beii, Strain RCC1491" /NCGR_SAMPLE_ID=MMETSP1338 /ASSEMBLY_ACC=CAM_ASM_000754 /LENGTH=165 /DNA_ID=CAMNT_0043221275 /DNA_START=57 /DNA_END=554 /DNA_ORIENTATION=+
MTAVQNDAIWRTQCAVEVTPLDRPKTTASELSDYKRNPFGWNYGAEPKFRPQTGSSMSSSYLTHSCSESRLTSYASSCVSRDRSSLLSAGRSSIAGKKSVRSLRSVRSSVLSVELEHERTQREAAEKEVAELKAQLAKSDPSQMRPAGVTLKKENLKNLNPLGVD